MGGLCTQNVQTLPDPKSILKDTQIPEWVSQGGQQLFGQAAELAQGEFPLFGGKRIAPLTAQEQAGLQVLEDDSGVYKPFLQTGAGLAAQIGQQEITPEAFGAAQLAQYQPAFQQAIDPALEDVSETFEKHRLDLGRAAGEIGAFGERRELEAAELTRGEAQERGRLQSEAGRQALEFSAAQFERDRAAEQRSFDLNQASRQMAQQAFTSMAPLAQELSQQEAQGLIGAGEAQRMLEQQALEVAYKDYVEQREYPFTALNFALGALKGLPFETREFTMQRGNQFLPSPSIYGQTLGGLGSLYSAYQLFKPKTTGD